MANEEAKANDLRQDALDYHESVNSTRKNLSK